LTAQILRGDHHQIDRDKVKIFSYQSVLIKHQDCSPLMMTNITVHIFGVKLYDCEHCVLAIKNFCNIVSYKKINDWICFSLFLFLLNLHLLDLRTDVFSIGLPLLAGSRLSTSSPPPPPISPTKSKTFGLFKTFSTLKMASFRRLRVFDVFKVSVVSTFLCHDQFGIIFDSFYDFGSKFEQLLNDRNPLKSYFKFKIFI
jgi:hypothetical protein